MIIHDTDIEGLKIIDISPFHDKRGFFARIFCREEFKRENLENEILQCNLAFNPKRGTLRGMHYQIHPHEEVKMVRCMTGSIFDVVIDLRKESRTYLQWRGFFLKADKYRMLYVPKGFAHGYMCMEDNSTVLYMVTESYHPECERAVRWDDSVVNIQWPLQNPILSKKDSNYPDIIL